MGLGERCVPCRGTGIYPLDIEAVESGRLRPENARGCGACYGTFRFTLTQDARREFAIQRNGGRNPFLEGGS